MVTVPSRRHLSVSPKCPILYSNMATRLGNSLGSSARPLLRIRPCMTETVQAWDRSPTVRLNSGSSSWTTCIHRLLAHSTLLCCRNRISLHSHQPSRSQDTLLMHATFHSCSRGERLATLDRTHEVLAVAALCSTTHMCRGDPLCMRANLHPGSRGEQLARLDRLYK